MQRIGILALAVVVAAVVWVTLAPGGGEDDAGAPGLSGAADPFQPQPRREPALELGRIDRESGAPAEPSSDAVADGGSDPDDDETREPGSTGGVDHGMTGGGGGEGPSRSRPQDRPPAEAGDPPPAPVDPLAPPGDLPADIPPGADPAPAPVDPAELARLEAEAATIAEQQGLDTSAAHAWAKSQVRPKSPPADQALQYQRAYNWFLSNQAIAGNLANGAGNPSAQQSDPVWLLSWQPDTVRFPLLKEYVATGKPDAGR